MEVAIVNNVTFVSLGFFLFLAFWGFCLLFVCWLVGLGFFLIINPESLLVFFTLKKFHDWTLKFHQDEPFAIICQSFCEEKIAFLGTQGQPGS